MNASDVERDRWGRYLIAPAGDPDAKPQAYTRVTTLAKNLDDSFGLTRWRARMVALGLAARHDLHALVAATDPTDKRVLDRICEDALEAAKGGAAANIGTALHTFTERIDRGEPVDVPQAWAADIDAYRATITEHRITIGDIEQIVVNEHLKVAGTLDRTLTHPALGKVIADVKTSQDLKYSWLTICVQLACYAHATSMYDPTTRTHGPPPDVRQDRAIVIHLPSGGGTCTLHVVDITAGWQAAQLCAQVAVWRKRDGLHEPLPTPADLETERRAQLAARIDNARPVDGALPALAARWPAGVPTLRTDHAHSDVELDLIERVMVSVEREFEIPF